MVRLKNIIWPFIAKQQFLVAYNYIKKDPVKNADKVRSGIILATLKLSKDPYKHKPDQYKTDNDGTFRAFELYRYRIAYHLTDTSIIIVRVRHTSMEPLEY